MFTSILYNLPSVFELFVLLRNSSVNLLSNHRDLKLSTADLGFFVFKSGLGLFECGGEFLFFHFETTSGLLHLVNTAASLGQLVSELVDLL